MKKRVIDFKKMSAKYTALAEKLRRDADTLALSGISMPAIDLREMARKADEMAKMLAPATGA